VRAPDIKVFPNKWDPTKQTWLMSFTIKDDCDTIDVKFWHKTQEHLQRYTHVTVKKKQVSDAALPVLVRSLDRQLNCHYVQFS
jgi:hypothetical protein